MAQSDGFQLTKLGDSGTFGAENAGTKQGIAFASEQQAKDFFGSPTISYGSAVAPTLDYQGLLGANAGRVLPVNQIAPASPMTIPTATPTPNAAPAAIAGADAAAKTLADYIKELTPPDTETSKNYDQLLGQVNQLLPGLTGRGADQLKGEQDAGIPGLSKQLADLNAEILAKSAELTQSNAQYEKAAQNVEGKAIPMSDIIGQQSQVRKMQLAESNAKSADLMLLQARASGIAGQVQAAQSIVNRAVDLKYADRESELNVKMQQLGLLQGKLDKEDTRTAQALERQYADQQEKLADEKAKAKENINLAFSANVQTPLMNKNGEWSRTSDGKTYGSPEDLFKDFPQLAGDFSKAYQMGIVTDVNAAKLGDLDFISQLRAKYPDAGIALTDTAESATKKLTNSRIYREETRPPQYAGTSQAGTLAGTPIIDSSTDAGVKALIASKVGTGADKGYGAAFAAVKAKYGDAVAQKYDKVYQSVFNGGSSVDAAFNDAKLNSVASSGGLVNSQGKAITLSAAQQGNIADWNTLNDLASQTLNLGNQIGFSGVGGGYNGTIQQFMAKQFGQGTKEEETLRNLISNIQGTIAKARGGTSFTPNEQRLLDSYTPTINDSPMVIQSKLASLQSFIQTTTGNIYSAAGAVNGNVPAVGTIIKDSSGKSWRVINSNGDLEPA